MTYYRILPRFDQKPRSDGSILVKNELYTKGEMLRYAIPYPFTEEVKIKKTNTYWFFGARFES